MTSETDEAIATYRRQLEAEAELAAGDLDEIEDHLRTLAAELRDRGMPAVDAIAEAARRLGDPRAVAREHGRVRTAFGAQLSRVRAWSAAAILGVLLVIYIVRVLPHGGVVSRYTAEFLFGVVLTVALVARISWARPILLAGMAFYAIPTALWTFYNNPLNATVLVVQIAVVAFLAPWRRGELTRAGLALSLQTFAYGSAMLATAFYTYRDGSWIVIDPFSTIAVIAAVVATIGGVLRARWSGIASYVSAIALFGALVGIRDFAVPGYEGFYFALRASVATGIVAALAGGFLAWRTARSRFGTLAHVLR